MIWVIVVLFLIAVVLWIAKADKKARERAEQMDYEIKREEARKDDQV